MFLRPHSRHKDGKDHTYWSLVETIRTPDGPRQKTLCYLGELNSSAEARWLTTVEVFNQQGETQQLKLFPSHVAPPADDPQVARVLLNKVRLERTRQFGACFLGLELWKRLELDRFFEQAVDDESADVPWWGVAALLAINRLCAPGSELAIEQRWYPSTALDDLLRIEEGKINDTRLYRCLDRILPHKTKLERHLSTFSISASPPQTTAPGGTAQYTITVNGSAGLGTVTLTAVGGPPGATVLLNWAGSASVAVGGTATLTVATPSNAGLGTYSVPITGMLGTVPKYGAASVTVGLATAASILTPMPGTIPGGATTFAWNNGQGATQYSLSIANPQGALYASGWTTATASPSISLPTTSQTIYVTLASATPNGTLSQLYVYTIVGSGATTTLRTLTLGRNGQEATVQVGAHLASGDSLTGCSALPGILSRVISAPQAAIGVTAAPSAAAGARQIACSTHNGAQLVQPLYLPLDYAIITGVDTDPYPAVAGQQATIQIFGSGFGDDGGTVEVSGSGLSTYAYYTGWSDGEIDLAPLTMAQAGTYGVTVWLNDDGDSEDYGTSGYFVVQPASPPTLNLLMNGTNITNSTQNVVVGQPISLTGQTDSAFYCSPQGFSTQGNIIGGFTANTQSFASGQAIPAVLLGTYGTTFYWVDGSTPSTTVSFSMTCGGQSYSVSAQFNIAAPSGATANPVSGTANIPPANGGGQIFLYLGHAPDNVGMQFSGTAVSPPNYAGQLLWVQLLDNINITFGCPNGPQVFASASGPLDNAYPYPPQGPGLPFNPTNDNPGAQLLWPPYNDAKYTLSAHAYLMWQASAVAGSIPVPLGYFTWNWYGHASYGPNNQGIGIWSQAFDSELQATVTDFLPFSSGVGVKNMQNSGYPAWSSVFSNPTGVPCQ